jgi:hypothetical protein
MNEARKGDGDSMSYVIATKFGKVSVTLDVRHAFISTDSTGPITVNSVEYHVSAHVYQWSDGTWHIGAEIGSDKTLTSSESPSIYMRGNTRAIAPRSVHDEAAAAILESFREFIQNNPDAAAEILQLRTELAALYSQEVQAGVNVGGVSVNFESLSEADVRNLAALLRNRKTGQAH